MQIYLKYIGPVWVARLLLIAAACAVYGPNLNAPFTFDDEASIVDNQSIRQLWPLIDDARHPGPLNFRAQNPTAGRPLVNLSFAFNYKFGTLAPAGYRTFNLVLHILSAWLVLAIVRRFLRYDFFEGRFDSGGDWLAFLAALLWMVHPLQTESVMYVTQRTELAVGFFYLATLYCSLRYWSAFSHGHPVRWLLLAILSCFAGMACKETMFTAPVMILIFERTFLRDTFRRAWKQSWRLYLGLFASWIFLLALNFNAPRSGSVGFHLNISPTTWWFTQSKVLWMYLKLACWPWPLRLHYHPPYLTSFGAAWPWLFMTLLLLIATAILLWRRRALGYAWAWVVVILSPTLVVPIVTEVAAERRMYLPLVALTTAFVVVGFVIVRAVVLHTRAIDSSTSFRRSLATIGFMSCLLAVVWGIVAARRAGLYRDEAALWSETVAQDPQDVVAQYNMGHALVKTGSPEGIRQSIAYFRNAIQLDPKYAEAYNNLGNALKETGQLAEAIVNYRQAIALHPDFPTAQYNLAVALTEERNWDEAIEHFQQAAQLRPGWADAHYNLGRSLFKVGRRSESIAEFQRALDARPDDLEAHSQLGRALMEDGHLPEAIRQFERALQLDPHRAQLHNNLGIALKQSGKNADAIEQYQEALQLDPDFAEAHNNLANVLFQSGKTDLAIEHFQQALQLNPRYVQACIGLAMAYQRVDRRAEAITAGEKALKLAHSAGERDLAEKIEVWLASYRANMQNNHSEIPPGQSHTSPAP